MKFSLNTKGLIINLRFVRDSFLLIVAIFLFNSVQAQVEPGVKAPQGVLHVKGDSTINSNDSLQTKNNTGKPAKKSDIETTINYSARDSIFSSMDSKMIWLYGDAKIKYGVIELEAEEVIIDYANNTVTAHGIKDSLGNVEGYPIFKNGAELYETKDIIYNFKTGRARISEVVTQQGEGYLHGATVFKNEKNELLSLNDSYTTCNLEHPHFRIRATKTKAIPNDKIIAGPFYMEFHDIPLPIGFLFGMFPAQRESKSGIIFPSYGEDRRRGFNLRNGGYFFDISEYVKLSLTGDIYTKGGYALYARTNYTKRYKHTGSANFSYSKTKTSDKIEAPEIQNDYYLTWSHTPQSKGTGRFSASVNAATSTYNKNNNMNMGLTNEYSTTRLNNTTTKLSSNVSYSKKFSNTPFSVGLNFTHNQDLTTELVDMSLPVLTLNMTNLYPFQRKSGKTGPLDNFSIGYTMAATNKITNNLGKIIPTDTQRDSIANFSFNNFGYFFDNAKRGIRHTIPTSFSFKLMKYFTVTPSVSLEEKWYFDRLNWNYDPTSKKIVSQRDTTVGFNNITNYNVSAGINTRLYGFYSFKKGKVKALRHIVNPSMSYTYAPDFSQNENYFDRVDVPNEEDPVYKSRHEGFIYGGSGLGRSSALGFSIGNNLEMKVKSEKDTVARKISLIDNLSIGSSYNFLADSFNLAPFNIQASTNVLNGLLNINLSATLDPYAYHRRDGTETKQGIEFRDKKYYAWNAGQGIGRITNAAVGIGTNLNPKGRDKENETRDKINNADIPEQDKQYMLSNPNAYIDFDIPWNLHINYTLSYGHPANIKPQVTQTLSFSGDVSLSEKWKINFNSGYHFESKEFTNTNLSLSRDLHCWVLNFTWVPFGRFQSYNFTINVKASVLQDLKMERRKPFMDNL